MKYLILVVLTFPAFTAQGQIYEYTDANGNKTITDRPPPCDKEKTLIVGTTRNIISLPSEDELTTAVAKHTAPNYEIGNSSAQKK